jgi:glycine/D-amino acid oxidase-like deaminating enzyme
MNTDADIVVIGGGIVGFSTATQLLENYPGRAVWVLEVPIRPMLSKILGAAPIIASSAGREAPLPA